MGDDSNAFTCVHDPKANLSAFMEKHFKEDMWINLQELLDVNLVFSVKIKYVGPFQTLMYWGKPPDNYIIEDVLYTVWIQLVHSLPMIELLLVSDPKGILWEELQH